MSVAIKVARLAGSMVLTAVALVIVPNAARACNGDCTGVTVEGLVAAVNIALGSAGVGTSTGFDCNQDGSVTIDEIVSGVNALRNGCLATPTTMVGTSPSASPTPSPTATATASATATPTPTITLTPTPNAPPVLPALSVYRTYTGYPIQLPIDASDPDGNTLTYAAGSLPDGAQLDPAAGVFSWTPAADQLGPFYVPYTVSDSGLPQQSVQGELVFKVSPPDPCVVPACDPGSGCESTLVPPLPLCCGGVASPVTLPRVAEPDLSDPSDCPGARVAFVGRNAVGFGKLQDCDSLPLVNFGQTGAEVRFNLETRCMRTTDAPVTVQVTMESSSPLHSTIVGAPNNSATVIMQPGPDGYAQRLLQGVQFPVNGGGPYFDLEGAEANLTVTVTDFDQVSVTQSVRVVLTFQNLADLPETP